MQRSDSQTFLTEALKAGFEVKLHLADVQEAIDEEQRVRAKIQEDKSKRLSENGEKLGYEMDWDDYYPLETFYEYFDNT